MDALRVIYVNGSHSGLLRDDAGNTITSDDNDFLDHLSLEFCKDSRAISVERVPYEETMTEKTYAIKVNSNEEPRLILQDSHGHALHYPTKKLAELHIESFKAMNGAYESDREYTIIDVTDD